ncbi:MAG TPA: hypothetical protein VGQ20_03575, partial [Acidimicrobiales bacterium]|nr:hypothetical protein [Acidimicrobiales bacterium]
GQRPRVSGATGESGDAGGLRNNPAFAEAMQACASLAPAGGGLGGANGAGSAAFDAYASCMKDHGVEVGSGLRGGASGATGATGSSGTPPTTVNRDDPAFIAANQVCEALLPARNVPGATTTTVQP